MLGHRALNAEDYLTILKRRWWIILIPTVILSVAGIGATYFVTPEYVSSTIVLIDQQKVPGDFVRPLVAQALDSRLAYMTEQIESRATFEPIITKYNLYADQHLQMDERVELARKALKIEAIQSELARANGLPGFKISFTANDPHTAQQVCSDITGLFTGNNLKSREEAAVNTTSFLQGQLDDAKRTLDDQDAKVAAFQKQYFGMLPGDEKDNVTIMETLNSRLDATTQAIQQLEQNKSVGEELMAAQAQPAVAAPGAPVAQNPQVQQKELEDLEAQEADLAAHYTPDYPDVKAVQRKIADLRAQMAKEAAAPAPKAPPAATSPSPRDSAYVVQLRAQLRMIDSQIAAKQKEQEDLKRQIQATTGKIQSAPGVDAQYKELTRDYETALAFYNSLLQKKQESQMTTSLEQHLQGETFTVLDAASVPTEPTYPKTTKFAGGGFALGFVLGVLIVALVDYRDTALRTERDVWELTNLPTLAVIAWSGDVAATKQGAATGIKRLFGRKPPEEALGDA
jgi:polysaccharide chain length determinant protein (PEP-CTERM system associated)